MATVGPLKFPREQHILDWRSDLLQDMPRTSAFAPASVVIAVAAHIHATPYGVTEPLRQHPCDIGHRIICEAVTLLRRVQRCLCCKSRNILGDHFSSPSIWLRWGWCSQRMVPNNSLGFCITSCRILNPPRASRTTRYLSCRLFLSRSPDRLL